MRVLEFRKINGWRVRMHKATAKRGEYVIVSGSSSWTGQWITPKGNCVDVIRYADTFQAAARACQAHSDRVM